MDALPLQVVCGLIVSGGRVLATRRDTARHFALLWEFPGGKVEAQESKESALLRELREELGLRVRIQESMKEVRYRSREINLDLHPFLCVPDQAHAPVPHEHVELRWVAPSQFASLEWAPPDIPLLAALPENSLLPW